MKTVVGSVAKTGERCPKTGMWKVLEAPDVKVTINKESIIPPFKGRSVTWEYEG